MLHFRPISASVGGELGTGFMLEVVRKFSPSPGRALTSHCPNQAWSSLGWHQGCCVSVGAWPAVPKPLMWAVDGWLEGAGEAALLELV